LTVSTSISPVRRERPQKEDTLVFYGVDAVINIVIQFLNQTNKIVYACVDQTRPILTLDILVLRKAFEDAKRRGVKLMYITEITKDNLTYCKQLIKMTHELRHLDGIKGNFYISESGYLAPATLHEKGKPASQIIYSNVNEIIEHQKYVFDSFWNKAISAEQRIKEIEEGKAHSETKILYGPEDTTKTMLSFLYNAQSQMNICANCTWPSVAIGVDAFKDAIFALRDRPALISKFVTEITQDNLQHCKELMKLGELRHLDNIKGNFAVSESEYIASATLEEGKPLSQLMYSNIKGTVEQQKYVFETLWNKAISAEQRIKEIEEGLTPEFYEVITDHEKATQTLVELAKSVKKEALFFLPNDKSLVRLERLGLIDYVMKASQSGATVKIICPLSEVNAEIVRRISETAPEIEILNGNNSPYGMYIGDGEKFIRAELRNPNAEKFSESIGFMVYSNRKTSVDSFKSIFELLWNERTLNEELKKAYRMQKEFINIASHELRTPVQAILGMSSLLQYYPEKKDELIQIIRKNAKRLQTLTDGILDVTRIESQTFQLEKEQFNLYELLSDVIKDFTEKIKSDNKNVKLVYDQKYTNHPPIIVEADKGRITQVLSNILNNALKFTNEGQIIVRAHESDNKKEIIVSITDTGSGINKDIFARLFSKFVTKSSQGTGLGLYISKSIVEAHGGKIWAENNKDKAGATFMFTLPVIAEVDDTYK
jgi:two-component system sensor histidine kinase VicK